MSSVPPKLTSSTRLLWKSSKASSLRLPVISVSQCETRCPWVDFGLAQLLQPVADRVLEAVVGAVADLQAHVCAQGLLDEHVVDLDLLRELAEQRVIWMNSCSP
ncbi:MAG: hypothetical protein R3D59_07140 [Paracoccaceae bacterium]